MRVGGWCHSSAALPPEMAWYPLYRRLDGPQGWSGWIEKILPHRLWSLDHLPHSESIHQLHCPNQWIKIKPHLSRSKSKLTCSITACCFYLQTVSFLLDPIHYLTNFPLLSPIFEMKVGKRNIIYSIVLKGSWCYIIRLSLLQDIHCPIKYRKLSHHCNGSLHLLFHLVILTNHIQSQITHLCCKSQPECHWSLDNGQGSHSSISKHAYYLHLEN
jgi:hypothetical protein